MGEGVMMKYAAHLVLARALGDQPRGPLRGQ